MAKELVPDELWEMLSPLLPEHEPSPKGGRPRIDDRKVLTGIIFVLRTGIPWEYLPLEMGCGSGMTCWRRLQEWHEAGVWEALKQTLLENLRGADQLDWSRAAVDSATVRAVGGGEKTGPNPTDRRKPGSKHHVVTDANGVPLKFILTAANRHDVTQLIPLIDGIEPVAGKPGRPKQRPEEVYADRADSETPTSVVSLVRRLFSLSALARPADMVVMSAHRRRWPGVQTARDYEHKHGTNRPQCHAQGNTLRLKRQASNPSNGGSSFGIHRRGTGRAVF